MNMRFACIVVGIYFVHQVVYIFNVVLSADAVSMSLILTTTTAAAAVAARSNARAHFPYSNEHARVSRVYDFRIGAPGIVFISIVAIIIIFIYYHVRTHNQARIEIISALCE